ncbi:hypothetical protein PFISCL1PPCAC_13662, partial [Pristionchus fissidentatus]
SHSTISPIATITSSSTVPMNPTVNSPFTVPQSPTIPTFPYSSIDLPFSTLLSAPLSPSTPLSSRLPARRRPPSPVTLFPSSPAKKSAPSKGDKMGQSAFSMGIDGGPPLLPAKKPAPSYDAKMLKSSVALGILTGQSASPSSPLSPSPPSTAAHASRPPFDASRENWNKIG